MNAKSTKKTDPERDTLRPGHRREDLGEGVRGKYRATFEANTNLVLLAPDVAEVFETPQAVNDALRSLISVAERSTRRGKASVQRRSTDKRTKKQG